MLLPLRAFLPFSYNAGQGDQVLQLQAGKGDTTAARASSWRSIALPTAQNSIKPALSLCLQPPSPSIPCRKAARYDHQATPLDRSTASSCPYLSGSRPKSYFRLLSATDFHDICISLIVFENSPASLQIGWNRPRDSEVVKGGVGEERAGDGGMCREQKRWDFNYWYSGTQTNEFFSTDTGKQLYVNSSVGIGASFDSNLRHTWKAAHARLKVLWEIFLTHLVFK